MENQKFENETEDYEGRILNAALELIDLVEKCLRNEKQFQEMPDNDQMTSRIMTVTSAVLAGMSTNFGRLSPQEMIEIGGTIQHAVVILTAKALDKDLLDMSHEIDSYRLRAITDVAANRSRYVFKKPD